MNEEVGIFKGKKYRTVDFVASNPDDVARKDCAFELGKCKRVLFALGQCYVKEGDEIIVNVYYHEEVTDEDEIN